MQHFGSYSGISYVKQTGGLKYLFILKMLVKTHTPLELSDNTYATGAKDIKFNILNTLNFMLSASPSLTCTY
jgi:hypothetical protein